MLPTTAAGLELEIESLMQKKEFKAALDKLRHLLACEYYPYNVHRDTLTCLIKLNQTDDALEHCEELLQDTESDHYYDYFEFYVVLLYETEKYTELIKLVEAEKGKIPEINASRIKDFKTLAMQMRTWQGEEALATMMEAVREKDARKQYRLLSQWKNRQFAIPDLFTQMLSDNAIHPVIKTELFILLQTAGSQADVEVAKFSQILSVSPSAMIPLTDHPSYLNCIEAIKETEQHNPVLYMFTKELIDNHSFVLYPFMYKEEDAKVIANLSLSIAKANLGMEEAVLNDDAVKEILVCQELYQHITLQ